MAYNRLKICMPGCIPSGTMATPVTSYPQHSPRQNWGPPHYHWIGPRADGVHPGQYLDPDRGSDEGWILAILYINSYLYTTFYVSPYKWREDDGIKNCTLLKLTSFMREKRKTKINPLEKGNCSQKKTRNGKRETGKRKWKAPGHTLVCFSVSVKPLANFNTRRHTHTAPASFSVFLHRF